MSESEIIDLKSRLRELEDQGTSGISELVDLLIKGGLRAGASDIHLEPGPKATGVRFRLDGVLQQVSETALALHPNIIARLKVLSGLLTYRTDVPQEGRIDATKYGGSVDLRVSTFPTIHGERAVVRIFDPRMEQFSLVELGFSQEVEKTLGGLLKRPQGVILLTGPAGSGKTTTIYAALRFIIQSSSAPRNIVSVEDPVECVVEGVSQTQINPAAGLTFARALRSLMRQDPEVIVIGEIRDIETAQIAMDAGLTGHLVISTIHAGTACGVFTRLLDMGIEPYLLTSAVSAVLAERLVRLLCPECKRLAESEEEFEGLEQALGAKAFVARGCPACLGTGYKGRTPIVELLQMNEPVRQAILSKSDTEELALAAKNEGMKTLLADGIQKIRSGDTSPQELRRVLVF